MSDSITDTTETTLAPSSTLPPRLKKGRIIHSFWYGPSECIDTVIMSGKLPHERYDYLIRPFFADANSPLIRQPRRFLSTPLDVTVLESALAALQLPVDKKINTSKQVVRTTLDSGDFLAAAKLIKALYLDKHYEDKKLDFDKLFSLVTKTIAHRAIATRKATDLNRGQPQDYLKRAEFVVKKIIDGHTEGVTIQHFYELRGALPPIKTTASASVATAGAASGNGASAPSLSAGMNAPHEMKETLATPAVPSATNGVVVDGFTQTGAEVSKPSSWWQPRGPRQTPKERPPLPPAFRDDGLPWYGQFPGEAHRRLAPQRLET